MAEVPAVVEVQTHEGVAGVKASQEDGGISLCAGMRLHVGILGSKELADAVDGKLLHLIDHLTATIVALARIALGIFVGQARAHGCHDLVTHIVLGGNEFHASALSLVLLLDEGEDGCVFLHI